MRGSCCVGRNRKTGVDLYTDLHSATRALSAHALRRETCDKPEMNKLHCSDMENVYKTRCKQYRL